MKSWSVRRWHRTRTMSSSPPSSASTSVPADRADSIATRTGATTTASTLPRFTTEARKANQPVIGLLEEIGREEGATPAQIALAWLLAQKPWIVPIPGTTRRHRLEENISGAAIELTIGDLEKIEQAFSRISVQGDRYPQAERELTGR